MAFSIVDLPANEVVLPLSYLAKHIVTMLVGTFGVHFMRRKRYVYLFHAAKYHSFYDNLSVANSSHIYLLPFFPHTRKSSTCTLVYVWKQNFEKCAVL
jgi:NAD(P)H-nitrite reductase large subunit